MQVTSDRAVSKDETRPTDARPALAVSRNASLIGTEVMAGIDRWIGANDRGAATVPVILPASESRWFREAFPDRCAGSSRRAA